MNSQTWRATAAEFGRTIDGYQKAAGALADLTPAKQALASLAKTLDGFYAGIDAGSVDKKKANAAILRLARILVPINFTREPRFRHDPAFTCPPLPTLATAAELSGMPAQLVGFGKTQLMRGQNRFVAAMREADRIVSAAMTRH